MSRVTSHVPTSPRTGQPRLGVPIQSSAVRRQKQALIGHLYRPGTRSTPRVVDTRDQDCPRLAPGVIIPHGLDDLQTHHGEIHLGTRHDSRELACDRWRQWWHAPGQADSPHASSLRLWCEGGGSHGARTNRCTAALERLAQETGFEVRVAPDPASTSPDNPLEHRLWPHRQRACRAFSSPVSKWCKS